MKLKLVDALVYVWALTGRAALHAIKTKHSATRRFIGDLL